MIISAMKCTAILSIPLENFNINMVHPVYAYLALLHLVNTTDSIERASIIYCSLGFREMRLCSSFLSVMRKSVQWKNEIFRLLTLPTSL